MFIVGLFVNGVLTKSIFININLIQKRGKLVNAGALLLHGLFEHKGRQSINAEWFENLGIKSHLINLPGHGDDAESKGDIVSWEENNKAVVEGFNSIGNKDKKILFGHSYGGLVATYAVLKQIIKPDYLILSAPLFEDNYPKFVRNLSGTMAKIAPKLRAPSPVTKKNISTDKSVAKDYFQDPLVFRSLTFRFGYAITEAQTFVNSNIEKLDVPTIVLHGKGDVLVPISGCEKISQLDNVRYIEVENSKHEILNQDTRPFVLSEIHHWLKENKVI